MALFSNVDRDTRLRTTPRPPGAPTLAPGPNQTLLSGSAQAPATTPSLLGDAPQTSRSRSDATTAALKAAERQRKRAAAGGRTIVTGQPVGTGINPPAVFAPKTLLGGGY